MTLTDEAKSLYISPLRKDFFKCKCHVLEAFLLLHLGEKFKVNKPGISFQFKGPFGCWTFGFPVLRSLGPRILQTATPIAVDCSSDPNLLLLVLTFTDQEYYVGDMTDCLHNRQNNNRVLNKWFKATIEIKEDQVLVKL
jgi:hypothetical protein